MTQDEMERWIDTMAASHVEHAERMTAHAQQLQEMRAQHQTLYRLIDRVAASQVNHEERITQNEETLRQVMITQQGIKDILERLNGR